MLTILAASKALGFVNKLLEIMPKKCIPSIIRQIHCAELAKDQA